MADLSEKLKDLFLAILALRMEGRWVKCIHACTKFFTLSEKDASVPDLAKAWVYQTRALAYHKIGSYESAWADIRTALELAPKDARIRNCRGYFHSEHGDYDRAIADFDKALELDPKLAGVYRHRAFVHEKKHNFHRAIADYTKALEIQPGELAVYNSRASAYANIGEYSRAIADCDEVLKKDPNNELALRGKSIATLLQLNAERQKKDRKHDQKQVEKQKEETGAEIKHQASQFLRRGEYDARHKEFQGDAREVSQKIKKIFIVLKAGATVFSAAILAVAVDAVWFSDAPNIPLFLKLISAAATVFAAPFLGELFYHQRKESSLMKLSQDAHTKSMLTDIASDPAMQKELLLKLFDHIAEHNSAQLIDKSGSGSAKLIAQLLSKPGG